MLVRWSVLLLLALVPLSGCLDDGAESLDSVDAASLEAVVVPGVDEVPAEEPVLSANATGAPVPRLPAVGFDAPVVVGAPVHVEGACPGHCVLPVRAEALPDGAVLEVIVSWDGAETVLSPTSEGATRGFDSLRWLLRGDGETELGLNGSGDVTARVRVLGPDLDFLAGDRMLPNIVTYAPAQIGIGDCDEVERQEQGATRCLRLGNAVGNVGDGPLQVRMDHADGALTPAGLGSFDQILLLRDGGSERVPVGNADFHPTHAHFHYDGFARFSLFEYDETTGLRGAVAAEHHKSGFCFLDWGEMQEPDRRPSEGGNAESACLIPDDEGWSMGVSTGWFDFYWSALTDQYVDVAGVPDGTYELVSVADWNDGLLETDESDNAASAVVRIDGDDVQVLELRAFYRLPEDTRNL